MIIASKCDLARVPILCTYVTTGVLSLLELSWFNVLVVRDLEREAWVANTTRTSDEASYNFYELMDKRPSLLLGPYRAVMISLLAIAFLVIGTEVRECRWALQSGIMITLELFLRTTCHTLWMMLPRWSYSQRLISRLNAPAWPQFRDFYFSLGHWMLYKGLGERLIGKKIHDSHLDKTQNGTSSAHSTAESFRPGRPMQMRNL